MAVVKSASADGSPFWRFSLKLYRLDGVADACLRLQDEAGADVNLLLFLLWCASERRRLSAGEVEALDGACEPWRRTAVVPLRTMRRALKSPPTLIEADAAEAYRGKIKAIELEAERLQQEAMYRRFQGGALGEGAPSVSAAARANLAAYAEVHDRPFAKTAIDSLCAAFAKAQGERTAEETD